MHDYHSLNQDLFGFEEIIQLLKQQHKQQLYYYIFKYPDTRTHFDYSPYGWVIIKVLLKLSQFKRQANQFNYS